MARSRQFSSEPTVSSAPAWRRRSARASREWMKARTGNPLSNSPSAVGRPVLPVAPVTRIIGFDMERASSFATTTERRADHGRAHVRPQLPGGSLDAGRGRVKDVDDLAKDHSLWRSQAVWRAVKRLARRAPPEPARPVARGGSIAAPPQLPRIRPLVAQPRGDRQTLRGARPSVARAQRTHAIGGLRRGLSRAGAERAGDGERARGDKARRCASRTLSGLRGRSGMARAYEQRRRRAPGRGLRRRGDAAKHLVGRAAELHAADVRTFAYAPAHPDWSDVAPRLLARLDREAHGDPNSSYAALRRELVGSLDAAWAPHAVGGPELPFVPVTLTWKARNPPLQHDHDLRHAPGRRP